MFHHIQLMSRNKLFFHLLSTAILKFHRKENGLQKEPTLSMRRT